MTFDVHALVRSPRVDDLVVAPDGTWAAAVVRRLDDDGVAYVSDLWRVPLDGGPAHRLTAGPACDVRPRFRPDGRLAFLSDRDPDGRAPSGDARRSQVWCFGPGAVGEPVAVTDEPLGVVDFAFTDRRLFVLAEVVPGVERERQRERGDDLRRGPSALHYRDGHVRHWDRWLPVTGLHLIALALDGTGAVDLTPDARHELRSLPDEPVLEAAGDRAVVAVGAVGDDRNDDSWLRVFDVADDGTATARDLGRAPCTTTIGARLSPDGQRVVATRLRRQPPAAERGRLALFDLAAGTVREVASAWDARSLPQAWTGPDSILAVADDDGDVPVFAVTLGGGGGGDAGQGAATGGGDRVERLTGAGCFARVGAVAGGGAVAIHHRINALPNAVRVGAERNLIALAELAPTPPEVAALAVERRTTPAGDGQPVTWFLVRGGEPAAAARPLLFWIHGGPESQFADGWHWRWCAAVAAAAGYAVCLPNPRGSTGRGQAWLDGVRGNQWGAACWDDLDRVCREVMAEPGVDGARAAALGGSFGGYMVNWLATRTDRFAALVSHAGIFHFPAFYGTNDYPAYFAMEAGGVPGQSGVDFERYSPHAHVDAWKTPVLITHGERDYRVPISEALLLYTALRDRGVEAELLVFPDEGHWIAQPRNVIAWYQAWQRFVGERLGT